MHFTCIIDFNLNMSALYQIFIAWPWKLASPFQPRVSAGQGYHMMPPLSEAPEALGEYDLVMHLVLFIHLSPNTYW